MPPVKVNRATALEFILDEIRAKLSKQDVFTNSSLAYYGLDLDYHIDLIFYSRAPIYQSVNGAKNVVEPDVTPEQLQSAQKVHLVVEGKRETGQKNKVAGSKPDYTPAGAAK